MERILKTFFLVIGISCPGKLLTMCERAREEIEAIGWLHENSPNPQDLPFSSIFSLSPSGSYNSSDSSLNTSSLESLRELYVAMGVTDSDVGSLSTLLTFNFTPLPNELIPWSTDVSVTMSMYSKEAPTEDDVPYTTLMPLVLLDEPIDQSPKTEELTAEKISPPPSCTFRCEFACPVAYTSFSSASSDLSVN